MDLSNLSVTELRELDACVQENLKNRQNKEIELARNEIYAIAHRLGLPLQSVLAKEGRSRTGKVAVRYRNPRNQSEEWSGRGRQPKWVQQMIAAGASIELARV